MLTKIFSSILFILLCLQLTGCKKLYGEEDSFLRDRTKDYVNAQEPKSLTLPQSMTTAKVKALHEVPNDPNEVVTVLEDEQAALENKMPDYVLRALAVDDTQPQAKEEIVEIVAAAPEPMVVSEVVEPVQVQNTPVIEAPLIEVAKIQEPDIQSETAIEVTAVQEAPTQTSPVVEVAKAQAPTQALVTPVEQAVAKATQTEVVNIVEATQEQTAKPAKQMTQMIDHTLFRVWLMSEFALDDSGFKIKKRDDQKKIFTLEAEQAQTEVAGDIQLRFIPDEAKTKLEVTDAKGKPAPEAVQKQLIDSITNFMEATS